MNDQIKKWLARIPANRNSVAKYVFWLLVILTVVSSCQQKAVGACVWLLSQSILTLCRNSSYLVGIAVLLLLWAFYRFLAGNWNLLEIIRGADKRLSTSKFQFFLWTLTALFAYASLYAARIGAGNAVSPGPDIPTNLLLAMGFSIASAVAAKGITVNQLNNGTGTKENINPDDARAGDLVQDDSGAVDLTKVQVIGWTIIAIGAYLASVARTIHDIKDFKSLPDIDPALMVLMGLGHGAYLGKKLIVTTAPTILKLTPTYVSIGADVTLTGSSFGATQLGSVITSQGIAPDPPVAVKSWADTSIVFTVSAPPFSVGQTAIAVTVDSQDSNKATVTVVDQKPGLSQGNGASKLPPAVSSIPISTPNNVPSTAGTILATAPGLVPVSTPINVPNTIGTI
jgi:hypothetical protein